MEISQVRGSQDHPDGSWVEFEGIKEGRDQGVSSDKEISAVIEWIMEMHKKDQERFVTQIISLDVEDVKVSYYDTLRMAGKLRIDPKYPVIRRRCDQEIF